VAGLQNPFNLLLACWRVLAGRRPQATVVIGSMVALSTVIRFVQERRSSRAAEALKAMVSNTATVWRRCGRGQAQAQERPIRELVPGDCLQLSAGDMIPADCRVLGAKDLFVAQAAMTGESMPVEVRPPGPAPRGRARRRAGAAQPALHGHQRGLGLGHGGGAGHRQPQLFRHAGGRTTATARAVTAFQAASTASAGC
jgi:Mg2+-importing ATPase